MYQRNIDILHNFEDFDFSPLKPSQELTYLSKAKNKSIFRIKGVPIQVKPHHIFTFTENDIDKVGAIYFVTKLHGYDIPEITLFTDALYRYLSLNYSEEFELSSDYCIAFDLISIQHIRYTEIQNNKVRSTLDSTLTAIQKLL